MMTDSPINVWVREGALALMIEQSFEAAPLETGGVLVGFGEAATGFVVTHAVGPGPDALHEKDAFEPDYAYHDREVARLYHASGRTETYLGDWHSHPGAGAYLSRPDRIALRRIATAREARLPHPLMAVIGCDPLEAGFWCLTRTPLLGLRRPRLCSVFLLSSAGGAAPLPLVS